MSECTHKECPCGERDKLKKQLADVVTELHGIETLTEAWWNARKNDVAPGADPFRGLFRVMGESAALEVVRLRVYMALKGAGECPMRGPGCE